MRDQVQDFRVSSMCRVLGVHRSRFYAWLQTPASERARDYARLLGLIKQSWLESGTVYGYRKICADLRDLGEACSRHLVARLMHAEGLKAQRGYGRYPGHRGGRPATIAPNRLEQRFDVAQRHRHHLPADARRLALPCGGD
jgi:putative transposase